MWTRTARSSRSKMGASVEGGADVAAALELEEPGRARHQHTTIPEPAGVLTLGGGADDRAEEGDPVDRDDGRPDLVPDEGDAALVAGPQQVVDRVVAGEARQRAVDADLVQRRGDDRIEVLLALDVDPGAHGVVEGLDDLVAVLLSRRDDDADGTPATVHQVAVLVGQVAALVEHRKAHDRPGDIHRPHPLDLFHPPRGHPGPRAQGVEPELGGRSRPWLRGLLGHHSGLDIGAHPSHSAISDRTGPKGATGQLACRGLRERAIMTAIHPRPTRRLSVPGKNLTRDEAIARAAIVSVDHYDVELDLTTSEKTFRTRTTVTFSSREPGAPTFIDLIAESVESISLNGQAIDPAAHFDGVRVQIPAVAEQNELVIDATGVYMNTGEGLHRFVDPVDNEVYLYSQFEVADCRRMFAVFEQPDLKATYAFTITAPSHWQVVSNSPTPLPTPAGEGTATWAFEPTPPISCYITALVAGPYAVVRDEVQTRKGTVPLGIFCRRSMLQHLDADNIFDCTKRGFAFFENEFDCEYPFAKYDQLFTPEYNMGAMENAGAVTINEIYVFRAKVTEAIIERRALTILHELAHMWFGNLVTMKWWNDLWLNESFGESASTSCQAEAIQWDSFLNDSATTEKAWAYRQDQLSSTHPIVAP